MMLDNTSYDKIKLIYKLSQMIWFIDKHALIDANNSGDKNSMDALIGLRKDLEKHLERLHKSACTVLQ